MKKVILIAIVGVFALVAALAMFTDEPEIPAALLDETRNCEGVNTDNAELTDVSFAGTKRMKVNLTVPADLDSAAIMERMQCTALRVYNELGHQRVAVNAFRTGEDIAVMTLKYAPAGDWAYQGDDNPPYKFGK